MAERDDAGVAVDESVNCGGRALRAEAAAGFVGDGEGVVFCEGGDVNAPRVASGEFLSAWQDMDEGTVRSILLRPSMSEEEDGL